MDWLGVSRGCALLGILGQVSRNAYFALFVNYCLQKFKFDLQKLRKI
jgi:hypothetical protein